ncbi:MAG: hypothetical protein U0793_14820 [Gemmataceae bacterium]
MDLLTRERALRNIAGLTSPTAAEYLLIDSLIAAVSEAVERYCCRAFAVQAYDELYDGNDRPTLLLRNFPVVSVERIAYEPAPVLTVQNTSASNQRASIKVSADGVTLTRVASGVTTSDSVTFAGAATLSALATAIAAVGNGWGASVASGYDSYASADLRATQGAFNARDAAADLRIHVRELSAFDVDETRGYLRRGAPGCLSSPVFYGGHNFWRVLYTAGFDVVPDAVQEACAEWVAALFWQSKRDPGLTQEATVGVTSHVVLQDMPAMARTLLRPYRVIRI